MSFEKKDAQRTLNLLIRFQSKLRDDTEKSLKISIDKLVSVLESSLFSSLMDIQEYYRQLLVEDISETVVENNNFQTKVNGNGRPEASSIPKLETDTTEKQFETTDNTSPWEYLEVEISRERGKTTSFGFSIDGGYDAPQENGDPTVFITRIAPNGIADRDGRLRPFDQVLSVNGTDISYISNQEAGRILRSSGDTLLLVIRRYTGGLESNSTQPFSAVDIRKQNSYLENTLDSGDNLYYEVELIKPAPNSSFGFSIAGGLSADVDGEQQEIPEGIFVTQISPGGLAEANGQMQPGDQLIRVNGMDLDQVTHEEAVNMLRNSGMHVSLVLCRLPPPEPSLPPDSSEMDDLEDPRRNQQMEPRDRYK